MKKTLALLLALVMVLGMFPVTTLAAATEPNVTITVDKTAVEVGDTITVELGITEMNAASIAIGFYFDNTLLEVASVTAKRNVKLDYNDYDPDAEEWFDDEIVCTSVSTKAEANASGYVGAVWAVDHEVLYYDKEAVVTVKFTAKENGTVNFLLKEDSSGTDGYKKDKMESGVSITIGSSEPSCDHKDKTYTYISNSNDTHKVTCECGEVVEAAATCSGGTATCTAKAKCADCGTEYGSVGDHAYGDLIAAQAEVHTENELKAGVAAHYQCSVCSKYFTENKAETTLEALTGETPEHTEDSSKTTIETGSASCTEGGKTVTTTFCACGKQLSTSETTSDALGHSWGTATYDWSSDYNTCTATRVCATDSNHTETETVNTTSSVTPGTCSEEEVTTYTASFKADWAEDQTQEVTGQVDSNNHTYDATTHICVCGAVNPAVVASVTINGVVTYHTDLDSVVSAVSSATAADNAVVTILQNIELGDSSMAFFSGVFTIDLNGYEISSTASGSGALVAMGSGVHVTIKDSGTTGKLTGNAYGVYAMANATVEISGGTITGSTAVYITGNLIISGGNIDGESRGVYVSGGSATITGGSIDGANIGMETLNSQVYLNGSSVYIDATNGPAVYSDGGTWTIIDGSVNGSTIGVKAENATVNISGGYIYGPRGVYVNNCTVNISDGLIAADRFGVTVNDSSELIISGGTFIMYGTVTDISNSDSTVTLTVGEDGTGATFPGGICVSGTTLAEILGDGAAYWQGETMITPAEGVTQIVTGDVVIKKACDHTNGSYTNNGEDHTFTCSDCGTSLTEDHVDGDDGNHDCDECGAANIEDHTEEEIPAIPAYCNTVGATTGTKCSECGEVLVPQTVIDALGHGNTKGFEYTDLGDGNHSVTCKDCDDVTITSEPHTYDETTQKCVCGVMNPAVVASVTINGVVTYHTDLDSAISAVSSATADDNAVVTILQDIVLLSYQEITSGVFTIDLNGCEISAQYTCLSITGSETNVTIMDSIGSGKITSIQDNGIVVTGAALTISGGTVSAGYYGVMANTDSIVTISGGSVSGDEAGMKGWYCNVTISGGSISSSINGCGIEAWYTIVNISGGSISGGSSKDIRSTSSTITLTVGEDDTGATFPGGITVYGTTLAEILGDGAAYWQGETMITPAEGVTQIVTGDVVIKKACDHTNGSYTNNGEDHTLSCSDCGTSLTEDHVDGDDGNHDCDECGAANIEDHTEEVIPAITPTCTTVGATTGTKCSECGEVLVPQTVIDALGHGNTNGFEYTDLGDGNHSVTCKDCDVVTITSEPHTYDETTHICVCGVMNPAVVASVTINGVVTYHTDLNSAISAVSSATAADNAVVTILQDIVMQKNQKIASGYFTIDLNGFEISCQQENWGALYINGSDTNVTIKDSGTTGKITGYYGIDIYSNATVTISGGTVSGSEHGVSAHTSEVTISGGTVSGDTLNGVSASYSEVTISGGTVSGDYRGIYVSDGTLIISGGTVSGNRNYGVYAYSSEVAISGGSISGSDGVRAYNNSTVTISGGSISGAYDILRNNSTITLTVGEDGTGATFPGGITVSGTYLNAILGEGAAYWQGETRITPAERATEITGGDVVIKTECKHTNENKTYNNNGENHTYTYSDCGTSLTEDHTYDEDTKTCVCGAIKPDDVASVTINDEVTYHTNLDSAINAVSSATAADNAVVTLLQDIDLGENHQRIASGVFTIDLNGFEISCQQRIRGALYIDGSDTNVTIKDSGTSGKITGYYGIQIYGNATVTISGGTVSGSEHGVSAHTSEVTISGGTVSGSMYGVYAENSKITISGGKVTGHDYDVYAYESEVTISGGTVSGSMYGVYAENSKITISGGSISGGVYDIGTNNSNITLTVGEDGTGATFPGGITVSGTNLNAILGDGAAYWQGETMITPAEDVTQIVTGDVVIKTECKHTNENKTYNNNGENHTWSYSDCNTSLTEDHTYDEDTKTCVCGAVNPAVVASVTINGVVTYHTDLDSAINAVSSATAADNAVVTILQNIDLGENPQRIASGVFTIDLNGFEISCQQEMLGALYIDGSDTNVTIKDSGTTGKITGDYGIEIYKATVTISGGTVSGNNYGVYANYSDVTVSGGTVSGNYGGVYANKSEVTISSGTVSGNDSYGVCAYYNSTVNISGGSISGSDGVRAYDYSTVTISGGTVSGNAYYGVYANESDVTISGGSISSENDIYTDNSTITLTVGEDGTGATFPGGISVIDTTLAEILDEGAGYWQGTAMITPAEGETEITGGDVVIKKACDHTNGSYTNIGEDHTFTCSDCGTSLTEDHTYDDTTHECVCGANSHDFATEIKREDQTCTEDGYVIYACDCGAEKREVLAASGHASVLVHNDESTHFEQCCVCTEILGESEPHTFDETTHICVCGAVETFTLTVYDIFWAEEVYSLTVPYGANLWDVLTQASEDGWIVKIGDRIRAELEGDFNGEAVITGYLASIDIDIDENTTMPGSDLEIFPDGYTVGWWYDGAAAVYYDALNDVYLQGWQYIEEDYDDVEGGAWYYFYAGTGDYEGCYLRAEGMTRAPYPTVEIDGNTYEADAETLIYCANKGVAFIDESEAWFYFDEDGKFQSDMTGIVAHPVLEDANSYVVNGMLAWHPGLVNVGAYLYFIGDETHGGNILATGDIYISRNTTDLEVTMGGVYTFDQTGVLCDFHGVAKDETLFSGLRYYQNGQLMLGAGLVKLGDDYIYVRSNGNLVVSAEYYVPANDLGIASGMYAFDENGCLINPELTEKDGIYWENNGWYYYENGKIGYNKGLIVTDKDWFDADGNSIWGEGGTIYVRSNGQLAIGTYYITNLANYDGDLAISSGAKLDFDDMGMLLSLKNGIVDGYYYVNNQIVYNAGVVKIGDSYYYVRSNGQVVKGQKYWITNVGDSGVIAKLYDFDANGVMQNPEFESEALDGIHNGYYYVDGEIAYGAGLVKIEEGVYIYVRSNGQIVTGEYWITNTNGLLPQGKYDFGTDGMLYA